MKWSISFEQGEGSAFLEGSPQEERDMQSPHALGNAATGTDYLDVAQLYEDTSNAFSAKFI